MTNNAELVIDNYSDELVTIDGETISLPKSVHALINIDGIKTFEITVADIVYADNTGYQIPVQGKVTFFMDPMTIDLDVSRLSTTSYEMGMSLKGGNLCDIALNAQAELKDDDFENFDNDGFETAAVQITLGDLSIRTMGDLAGLLALDDPTETQVNSLTDLDLFYQDVKIADLEYSEAMETILIFYKDGTSENFDDIISDLEEILEDLFG